jgi:hypothetical protein
LDRWQPNAQMTSPPTQPPKPRQTSPVRKAFSDLSMRLEPSSMKPSTPTPVPTTPSPSPAKDFKTKTSYPHLHPDPLAPSEPLSPRRVKIAEKMLPPERGPGFGSATTMVVYKPKTPEPPSSLGEPSSSSVVDELGVKYDPSPDGKGRLRFSVPSDIPGPTGKPLNHVRSFW